MAVTTYNLISIDKDTVWAYLSSNDTVYVKKRGDKNYYYIGMFDVNSITRMITDNDYTFFYESIYLSSSHTSSEEPSEPSEPTEPIELTESEGE